MENIPDSPEGIILESLLEGMNQYYSAELSQKVKRGMKETRLKGNFTGGHLIYGYKLENHKIMINEEQAEVVRYIYKQYSLGIYVKDIINELTKQRIFNNGKPFARNTIYNILKNEKYAGIYKFNNEVFDNMYPQIVPAEIYDKVRKIIEMNKYGKRSTEVIYLLRHKLKCGYCGQPISADCGTTKQGKKMHYYKCLGRKRNNGCKKSVIRKEVLEDFIIENILSVLDSPKYINDIVKGLLIAQNELANGNSLLASLTKEKKQVETTLNNIMKAVEQGLMNNTTNKRMKELETQLEELDRQILIEKSKNICKLDESTIKEYYLKALKLEPFMLINYLIKEIKLYDDKMEITFNSPIRKSPNDKGFLLCTKFEKFGIIVMYKSEFEYIDMQINFYV